MKFITKPRSILIAETKTDEDGLSDFLSEVGAHVLDEKTWDMDLWQTDAPSGSEELVEIAGRACYRSFRPGLNENVTKVREGNRPYIGNILKQKHGSVLEHGSVSFAFLGVSRVFTHELVRHRVGTAFSQESLRYVRLTDLAMWYPRCFQELTRDEPVTTEDMERWQIPAEYVPNGERVSQRDVVANIFVKTVRHLEYMQRLLGRVLELDDPDADFNRKKKLTSAMRRLAPIGLGTAIVCTANHRTWRHTIEQRTSPHAEEEIVLVFQDVANQLLKRFPNIYQDMVVSGEGHYTFP